MSGLGWAVVRPYRRNPLRAGPDGGPVRGRESNSAPILPAGKVPRVRTGGQYFCLVFGALRRPVMRAGGRGRLVAPALRAMMEVKRLAWRLDGGSLGFPRALRSEIVQGAPEEPTRLRLSCYLELSEDPVPSCVVTAFAASAARAAPIWFERREQDGSG